MRSRLLLLLAQITATTLNFLRYLSVQGGKEAAGDPWKGPAGLTTSLQPRKSRLGASGNCSL